ncbi:adenylate/guanylate cyclase domain-containing protein [soil metagenome]
MAAERVERKLAAILAADLAGYSRLMGADEEGTLARLTTHRREVFDPAIARHRGRIVKTTGDGLLAEFASVVDAVRCAAEVQAGMAERNAVPGSAPRLDFRIGINVGDIVMQDDDIFGDGVNIAARLESIADPGGICVSQRVQEDAAGKTGMIFEDMGEQSLKNIARPIRVYRVRIDGGANPGAATPPAPKENLALPDKPSIAVLPFQNMSGDVEQDYFADGMVEDITTGLSRIKWLFVIARNSSFSYKGKAVDVRHVGRELGVRYVLEGGVRKVGSRVRITAQLLETETGAHLWADKFDGALEDIFELQDQITDRVVGIVEPNLRQSEIERSRRKRPENLDAYDLYLRALPYLAAQMPEQAKTAQPLLEEAVRLDPGYAAAHAHLAWCHELCFARGGFDEAHKVAGLLHARATIASSTDDATALAVAGFVMTLLSKEHEAALGAIDRALSLNASCATALYLGAQANALAGYPEPAISFANRALRLSPFDPLAFQAHMALGEAALMEARYDDAASSFAKAGQANSNFSTPYFFQAIALALAGHVEEAHSFVRRGSELEPDFRTRLFSELGLAPALVEKLAEGSRLVGLPE